MLVGARASSAPERRASRVCGLTMHARDHRWVPARYLPRGACNYARPATPAAGDGRVSLAILRRNLPATEANAKELPFSPSRRLLEPLLDHRPQGSQIVGE